MDDTPLTSVASTSLAWGRTVYLPRPMSSRRTFSVSNVSMLNTVVRLVNVGTPTVLMYAGRNEPRPASEYPHADVEITKGNHEITKSNHRDTEAHSRHIIFLLRALSSLCLRASA